MCLQCKLLNNSNGFHKKIPQLKQFERMPKKIICRSTFGVPSLATTSDHMCMQEIQCSCQFHFILSLWSTLANTGVFYHSRLYISKSCCFRVTQLKLVTCIIEFVIFSRQLSIMSRTCCFILHYMCGSHKSSTIIFVTTYLVLPLNFWMTPSKVNRDANNGHLHL